jgi:uncharacterized membrane protein
MGWLWGIVGALLAVALSEGEPIAVLLGFAAGWLLAGLQAQRDELELLRRRVVRLESESDLAVPASPERPATPLPSVETAARSVPLEASVAERPRVSTRPHAAVRPLPPPEWEMRLRAAVARWFSEGNVPVKLGIVVLTVGVAAALRYAARRGIFDISVELRLAGIAAAALGALAFGWRERERRRPFGLSLQGGALGILLLTIFAAFRLYAVLPPGAAFAWMVVVVAGGAFLAVTQSSLALAVLSASGGFLAPVLVSSGGGSHVALFSYYALLDAGVFVVVWLRGWRWLARVGFAFTFVIGAIWGARYYRPEFFSSTEPFLILFFLGYVALAVLDAVRRDEASRDAVDGTLVFGVPLCAFPLQAALLQGQTFALAASALAIALVYASLALWALRRRRLVTLGTSFAALAVGFAALAVPLALSARWTACTWAVQGAALIWLGIRLRRAVSCYFGAALHVLAIGAHVTALVAVSTGAPIVNGEAFAGVLVSASLLFGAHRFEHDGAWPRFGLAAFCAGWGVWALCGMHETLRFATSLQIPVWAGFIAATLAICALLRERLAWARSEWPISVALVLSLFWALIRWEEGRTSALDWITWPLALAAGAYALRALEQPRARSIAVAHSAALATFAALLGGELALRSAALGMGSAWSAAGAASPLALLLVATWRRAEIAAFPLTHAFPTYRMYWFALASLGLATWWLWSLALDGSTRPLPFVPLLNPLEPLQLASVGLVYALWREHAPASRRTELASAALGTGFLTLSMLTLRGVHQWGGVPWDLALIARSVTQTSLSVVWSALGVSAWIVGSRRGSRPVWLAGASLMGLVLTKLFFVDRTHMGDLSGIVSFVVVGLLMIAVGYIAPSPPRERPAQRGS